MADQKEQHQVVSYPKEMTPWEQHSAVISIPRFDYKAPSSLLLNSHTGFLITCPIKREKSATKEAMSILAKYIASMSTCDSECLDASDANGDFKRRKVHVEEVSTKSANDEKPTGVTECGDISKDTSSSMPKMEVNGEKGLLSLVKLTRSGLLLLTFPSKISADTTDIVSNIFQSMDAGKPPSWCHRIFPIQATCKLNEEDIRPVVSRLVQQFLDSNQDKLERPRKFAVGYNRRGMDEVEGKPQKTNSKDSNFPALLDRNKCFGLVASVVNEKIADCIVDLKSPQFAVLVELLPLSGIPNGSLVVAISVLPCNLIITKPKLSIKPLNSDTKTKNAST